MCETVKLMQDLHIQKNIPYEVIKIIFRYSYRTQSDSIKNDIKSYVELLDKTRKIDHHRWHRIEPDQSAVWLLNDITRFANSSRPTILGIHPKMRDILSRFYMQNLPQPKNICAKFISICHLDGVSSRINAFWGIFTCTERKQFIEEYGCLWDY